MKGIVNGDGKTVMPLSRSLKASVLPAVAVKIALGARLARDGANAAVVFEGQADLMHLEDFEIAAKAAKRLAPRMQGKRGATALMEAVELARGLVCEEIFFPGLLRVIFYPSVVDASAYYRCILPASACNAGARVHADISKTHSIKEALDYDVVLLQLAHDEATLNFARTLKDMGKRIVFELDDAFDALEPWHDRYETYAQPETRERMRKMLAVADLVTVTTEHLKARYADSAKRIAVVPNCIVPGDYSKPDLHHPGEFRCLWAGSPSHGGDLAVAAAALADFARAHADVRLIFFGRTPPHMDLPDGVARHVPFVPYRDYPAKLASFAADVAIAPLADVPFNAGKSAIKLLEYGSCGYPIIASDVPPYRDALIGPGPSLDYGILVAADEWRTALEGVYVRPDLRAAMAERAKELAREHDVSRYTSAIEGVYLSLK